MASRWRLGGRTAVAPLIRPLRSGRRNSSGAISLASSSSGAACGAASRAALIGARLQVAGEPVPGQPGDQLKRAWFGEQAGGAYDDLQARPAPQLAPRLPIQLHDRR